MKEFDIRLRSVQDVHDFVNLVSSKPFTILVCDGYCRVNGKSFTEMFSLNFNNQLRVMSEGYDWEYEQLLRDAQRFMVHY